MKEGRKGGNTRTKKTSSFVLSVKFWFCPYMIKLVYWEHSTRTWPRTLFLPSHTYAFLLLFLSLFWSARLSRGLELNSEFCRLVDVAIAYALVSLLAPALHTCILCRHALPWILCCRVTPVYDSRYSTVHAYLVLESAVVPLKGKDPRSDQSYDLACCYVKSSVDIVVWVKDQSSLLNPYLYWTLSRQ